MHPAKKPWVLPQLDCTPNCAGFQRRAAQKQIAYCAHLSRDGDVLQPGAEGQQGIGAAALRRQLAAQHLDRHGVTAGGHTWWTQVEALLEA